ncbi:glucosamine-6-phosphate deaminase [Salmonella enterica]|nr:glucosamine-6-phosphate deaminase [Salmonella enterica]
MLHTVGYAFFTGAEIDAPRDKCAPFREINGIAAAFQYSQKNYNPTASSFL